MTSGWRFDIVNDFAFEVAATRAFTGYISKYKSAGVDLAVCHSRPEGGLLITPTTRELGLGPLGYASRYGVEVVHSKSNAPVEYAVESRFCRDPP